MTNIVTCINCGQKVRVDDEMFKIGWVVICPTCGHHIKLDKIIHFKRNPFIS